MFVLDTNVVSELMRPRPEPAVESWLGRQPASSLYFTAIGEAELRYGVAVMPRGARREALAAEIEGVLSVDLKDRVLPFDSQAARAYAEIAARRRAGGASFIRLRLSDRGDRQLPRRDDRDQKHAGLRGNGDRSHRSLDTRGRNTMTEISIVTVEEQPLLAARTSATFTDMYDLLA